MDIKKVFNIETGNKKVVIIFVVITIILIGGVLMFNFFGSNVKASTNTTNESNNGNVEVQQNVSLKKATYQKISATEVKKMLDEKQNFILMDVRTKDEYDSGHIPGATLHTLSEISTVANEVKDKNEKIIVYCRSGARSAQAANALINMGYQNIYDLGGIINWPYDVTK